MPNNEKSNSGNVSNDRAKASEAGKKGGESSTSSTSQSRDKASEAGRKGHDTSHGANRKA
ncbi:KGG domain-containing protein [Pseudomonas sp.]|uniref:general stress protein n=1 Tax=Pseudomonas sp. TaxID=306 RepID=UPI00262367DA|nr:KGG domain-containing protein [Pseudomonas sp.]